MTAEVIPEKIAGLGRAVGTRGGSRPSAKIMGRDINLSSLGNVVNREVMRTRGRCGLGSGMKNRRASGAIIEGKLADEK